MRDFLKNSVPSLQIIKDFYTPSIEKKSRKVTKKFCTPLNIDEKISYPIIFFPKTFIPHYLFPKNSIPLHFHLQLGIGT